MTTLIRAATLDDVPALGTLAGKLVRFHHELDPARFLRGEGVEEGYGHWLGKESQNPDAVVVVAEVEGRVVGYAYGRYERKDWNDLLDAHGKLHDVFVDASARRRDLGRALVLRTCELLKARGAPRVVLSTAVTNAAARGLFESLGFRTTMLEMTRELGQ